MKNMNIRLTAMLLLLSMPIFLFGQADAGVDKTICEGTSVQIGTPGDGSSCYSWSPKTGLDNPNSPMPIATVTSTTTYTLTVYGKDFSFKDTDAITISVYKNTPFPSAGTSLQQVAPQNCVLTSCDYGCADTERVEIDITACLDGGQWKAVLTKLIGLYSVQARLLSGQMEVTGPTGNTTMANACDQMQELDVLGFCPGQWYMLSAVVAHEQVHATSFGPALINATATIEASIESLTVADSQTKTQAQAISELKALGTYTTAVANARLIWDNEYVMLIRKDHNPGGPAEIAERGVVDPMIQSICAHAKASGWIPPACGTVCN